MRPAFVAAVLLLITLRAESSAVGQPTTAFDLKELATYRLTVPVLEQFERATRLLGEVTRDDPGFAAQPLFNRDISLSGDAPVMAAALEARLRNDARLASALGSAGLTAREYTKFALSLFAAHLAHGFVKSGVLAAVPAGVATDNVTFIAEHAEQIAHVLKALEAMAQPGGVPFDSGAILGLEALGDRDHQVGNQDKWRADHEDHHRDQQHHADNLDGALKIPNHSAASLAGARAATGR
jgi:hypothetical protein